MQQEIKQSTLFIGSKTLNIVKKIDFHATILSGNNMYLFEMKHSHEETNSFRVNLILNQYHNAVEYISGIYTFCTDLEIYIGLACIQHCII